MNGAGFTLLELTLALALFGAAAAATLTLQAQSARLLRQAATLEVVAETGRQTLHALRTSGVPAGEAACLDPWFGAGGMAVSCVVVVEACDLSAGRLHCPASGAGAIDRVTLVLQAAGDAPLVLDTLLGRR